MGIPGFSSWLRERYPEAFSDLNTDASYDNVYIDLQSTLHMVTRKARHRHVFHSKLHRRLDTLLATLSPTNRVVLAMDGPAPLAKLLEQRRRRRRESDRSEHAERAAAALLEEQNPGYRINPRMAVSPLFLTTGTLFMLEVHNSLVYYICHRLSNPQYKHLHFELSDSTVKGEGELKILSRLVHAAAENSDESHLVVGGDSDLLIMSIASGQRHVTLWNDAPHRRHRDTSIFERDALEEIWRKEHLSVDATQAEIAELGLNLALLAILSSGNDYLPGCQGLGLANRGKPGLWSLFLDMRNQPEFKSKSLIRRKCGKDGDSVTAADVVQDSNECSSSSSSGDDQRISLSEFNTAEVVIDRKMLATLLRRFSEQRYFSSGDHTSNGEELDPDFVQGAWNYGIDPKKKENGQPSPLPVFPPSKQPWKLEADPEAYLEGLEWVLTMYATGSVADYRFSYPAQPPTLTSLVETLEGSSAGGSVTQSVDESLGEVVEGGASAVAEVDSGTVNGGKKSKKGPKKALQPLIPAACALALLPARSRLQAAAPLRHLMDADSPVAEIYAVCKECQQIATEIRSVTAQMDEVREQLAELQSRLGEAGPDAESAIDAEGDLTAAAEGFEAAQEKLRDLMRELSRSQQEHLIEKHPWKPFPTNELEAAVMAVPRDSYPPRQRRLASFGREMLYKSMDNDSSTGKTAQKEANRDVAAFPGWLRDAEKFATSYPKLGDMQIVQGAAAGVIREVLPLHPYMQPGVAAGPARTSTTLRRGRSGEAPSAGAMASQYRRYSSGRSVGYVSPMLARSTMWGRPLSSCSSSGSGGFVAGAASGGAVLPSCHTRSRLVQVALRTCATVLPRLRAL